jgi:uncharacterized protein YoxC
VFKSALVSAILRVIGTFGFLVHITGAILVVAARPIWVGAIQNSASKTLGEIEEIKSLLLSTENSLSSASVALSDTSELMLETGQFIQNSNVLLRSVGRVIGEDAPSTIQSTYDALEAAQSGSRAVDAMLRGLSILEPVTGFSYNPEKSLSQSLEEVANGLEPLPESLREIQRQLNQVAVELDDVQPTLNAVALDLMDFSESTEELSTAMKSQVESISSLSSDAEEFLQGVAAVGRISTIIVSVFLTFGAISQLSVFLIGYQMRSGREAQNLS